MRCVGRFREPRRPSKTQPAISEAQLETLIPHFYARVREDALIGPVFDGAIADWDHHLEKLMAFWSSVMLTSGRYKGNPVAAHLKHLSAITPPMFDRWLSLWAEVTGELLPPPRPPRFRPKRRASPRASSSLCISASRRGLDRSPLRRHHIS